VSKHEEEEEEDKTSNTTKEPAADLADCRQYIVKRRSGCQPPMGNQVSLPKGNCYH
jgi:predicted nucleic acid-binding protein